VQLENFAPGDRGRFEVDFGRWGADIGLVPSVRHVRKKRAGTVCQHLCPM
jgi:hypothetical protein